MKLLRNLKWRFAMQLARWSLRLRGQKVYAMGWDFIGNEAAMLNDRIMTTLIIQEYYKWDSYPGIGLDLERLTQMAGATCYHPRLKETAETFNKESGAR